MKSGLKFYGSFVLMLLIIVGWVIFLYFISPTTIVERIGIENAYTIAFVLAVICGFSSLTATTFYVAVATLSSGGANPWLLGAAGGLGLCISDFLFYFVISHGTPIVDRRWKKLSNFIKKKVKSMPDWFLYPFIFLYSALAPIPNDVMLVGLAIGDTPFKKIAPFLFAGDVASILILAYITH